MKVFYFIFFLIFPCTMILASQDYYHFSTNTEQQRFEALTKELRCLVCQNQNIAESNAALAQDLRGKVYKQIQAGQSDKEIVDYLVVRYGNFIRYRPPLNRHTMGLWCSPFLLLLIAMGYLFYFIYSRRREE